MYFQYLSNSKNNITFLDAYHLEKIFDKYIIRISEKGFILVVYSSKVYRIPNTHEYIDRNLLLHLVLNIDVR